MSRVAEKKLDFEEAMEQLEQIVQHLEGGNVPLEKAIELFQDGMKLSNLCSQKLEQVEKKIEILVGEESSLEKRTFELPENSKGDNV